LRSPGTVKQFIRNFLIGLLSGVSSLSFHNRRCNFCESKTPARWLAFCCRTLIGTQKMGPPKYSGGPGSCLIVEKLLFFNLFYFPNFKEKTEKTLILLLLK
jgi:hypothetical protein